MRVLAYFLLIGVSSVLSSQVQEEWTLYKHDFNKEYKTLEEEQLRKTIWLKNKIFTDNFPRQNPGAAFQVEINGISDKQIQELTKREKPLTPPKSLVSSVQLSNIRDPPASFDWRTQGVIGPVKNQGEMGDVFDIAAEECVESLNAIKTKKLVSLSIAQIEDCCGTQSLIDPFQCINRKLGGLCLAQDYPTPKGSCDAKSCKPVAPVSGSYHIKSGNETDLQLALLQAPVFVAVDASQPSFLMYSGGIYGDPQCSSTQIDHVLQLVGYGVEDGTPFWICRNSWGASWGENGYIRMVRGKNMCGIATYALLPL